MSIRAAQFEVRPYLRSMQSRIRHILLRIAAAVVAALHAGLLWNRIDDLSITEPQVIARWCAAAVTAAVALFLFHQRVSRRTWLVFWIAVVLLHAVAPSQNVRIDVLTETIFVIAPLILLFAGPAFSPVSGSPATVADERFPRFLTLLAASLPSRAPPVS